MIEGAISSVRAAAAPAAAEGGARLNLPVVVIFESSRRIEQFLQAFPQYKDDCQIIDRNTTPKDVADRVACATTNSMLTLVDRAFGRGTDFKCKTCMCLTVIQTFLPPTISEEVQMRGRTGRQGEPGCVKVVLLPAQVANALAPPENSGLPSYEDDVSEIKAMFDRGEANHEFAFAKEREEIETFDVRAREAAAVKQRRSDEQATDFIRSMFSAATDRAAKLQVVLDACRVGNAHVARPAAYLLILDASISMQSEGRWPALKDATSGTLQVLRRAQPSAFVIIVVFGQQGTAREFKAGLAADIAPSCLDETEPNHGTEYFDAFDASARSVAAHQAQLAARALHVLFMTDGGDVPRRGRAVSEPVERMLQAHDVSAYYYVLFGSSIHGTNPSLQAIDSTFKRYGVQPQQRTAGTVVQLTTAFEEIVQSGGAY